MHIMMEPGTPTAKIEAVKAAVSAAGFRFFPHNLQTQVAIVLNDFGIKPPPDPNVFAQLEGVEGIIPAETCVPEDLFEPIPVPT